MINFNFLFAKAITEPLHAIVLLITEYCGCAGKTVKSLYEHVPYLSASAVVIDYEEVLYRVYAPLPYLYRTNGVGN